MRNKVLTSGRSLSSLSSGHKCEIDLFSVLLDKMVFSQLLNCAKVIKLEMWANVQRDGRPAEYRWRPLLNAAVWLTPTTRVPCSNAAKTRNPLKLAGVPQTNETISAASRPKLTILWGHLEEILLLNNFFSDCRHVP